MPAAAAQRTPARGWPASRAVYALHAAVVRAGRLMFIHVRGVRRRVLTGTLDVDVH